jgi:hypothetical protein
VRSFIAWRVKVVDFKDIEFIRLVVLAGARVVRLEPFVANDSDRIAFASRE